MYPLLLQPTLHVKVWGGRKLESALHKPLPTSDPYGESWELHDTSTVANGADAGRTLGDLLVQHGAALIGDNDPAEGMPLLAKFIDAADWLSVQVHPNDAQARQLEGQPRGKTEAWYILAADPGAQLVIGVEPGTTREAMAAAIRTNTMEPQLVYAEVQPGDVLYMPAGTVHAIGAGVLLYEIQQSSDTTYRLYDWGRMDLDGKPRALHIDKGVQVANVETLPQVDHTGGDDRLVIAGDYFITHRHTRDVTLDTEGRTFHALTCVQGEAVVGATGGDPVRFTTGQTVLIPAALGAYTLTVNGQVLRSQQR